MRTMRFDTYDELLTLLRGKIGARNLGLLD